MLTLEEGAALVKAARKAFFAYCENGETRGNSLTVPPGLGTKNGAYVRVGVFAEQRLNGRELILGFTGYPMPHRSLYHSVVDATTAIAVRTGSLPAERNSISFEVTALSPPEALKPKTPGQMVDMVKLGRDALMVSSEGTKAIVLPQTAVRNCKDETEFLGECCMAAGLMGDAWLTMPEIGIFRFQAQIFRETGHDKKVVEISLSR